VLLISLFQECVSNFAINVLLLQNATITEQNVGVNILESGGLAKPEELIMYKAVLNSVQSLNVIYNRPTCFSHKVLYKSMCTNRHTDANETSGQKEARTTSPLRWVSVGIAWMMFCAASKAPWGDALGEDGCFGGVKLQASILLEDMLELSQDLKRHAQLGLDVTVIRVRNRPGLLELCENTSP
jgi:hypothetical protein